MTFRALVLTQGADRKVSGAIETLAEDRLPAGDVVVAIDYSTLNYKDGLVLTTGGGLVKTWPHVGGIDFAGTVESSENPAFKAGDKVVLNGYRVGELHWGGYATKARVKGDWLVKLPAGLSTRHAMAIGTAGYTSMLCVLALEHNGVTPASGPILVTGAAGGIGEAIARTLAGLGARVIVNSSSSIEAGKRVANEIGGRYVRADIARRDEGRALVDACIEEFGQLDILVNNAGWTSLVAHHDLDALTDELLIRVQPLAGFCRHGLCDGDGLHESQQRDNNGEWENPQKYAQV